ncbi:hypothetical protein [Parabacteroides sp. ZJ-118]|uniref:hypothetical protein n=1 Tax=Parabacteroides sp. ZJ-118 TaxID=2709398 RepID=UPI0013ED8530|nr:hypothetical protein [Parabacteroides sp. ZJ-118]
MGNSPELQTLVDEEMIARILFSPSMILDGAISPSAFFLAILKSGDPESYLSVWRIALKVPSRENVKFKPRKEGDTLYGYAELSVGSCHRVKTQGYHCKVMVNPHSPNQYHAGIYYYRDEKPMIGASYAPEFVMMASYLASQSRLITIESKAGS